ncbi:hypothetical protein IHQ71_28680 [Rhizobium sp. TH2]|uniref:hypothetical protein n=1 Tax=Rhizobium sp. TH2 TaxID=2775403 RepID=UPI0021581EA3|nr:hypothetical protein [Rhizobium sp. TH2]UVC09035.1 hypothetical protein IHQ71_28680 [Rhizobium sp. TH2]
MATDRGKPIAGPTYLVAWRRPDLNDQVSYGRFSLMILLFSLAIIAFQLALWFLKAKDYVGMDPDDAMRLVEVRDYLGGQGWFDLTQYRLGPDGGTLMHWSRLIDWPIATLVSLYAPFLSPHQAEVAAVATWPLLLVVPLLASIGLASYRLGGKGGMVIGLLLSVVFLAAIVRFRPGAIDHHNVQLVLAAFMTAMLIDPLARASNFAAAAVAGGLALAIGAETTPLVAVSAIVVAVLWAIDSERYRRAAIGFGLAFAAATGAIFFGTTPLGHYGSVTCDTLSLGYLSLATVGGAALAASAFVLTDKPIHIRFTALVLAGILVLATAILVAPECLQNPLNNLDPLLKSMWLSTIKEAQSIVAEMQHSPEDIGGFYAVGLLALAVCFMRIMRREQTIAHAILLALIGISWVVSALQVRGMMFANFLAFIPLSALIADLRALYVSRQKDSRAALAFVMAALLSVPAVWTMGGMAAFKAGDAIAGVPANRDAEDPDAEACVTEKRVADFARMPAGRILAGFNTGPALLRFTPHSVLAANYHRNQAGMIATLKIAMAKPQDALPMMEAQGVGYVLFCNDDPLVDLMKTKYPDGFLAQLGKGDVPGYLEEIPQRAAGLHIYQMIQR